MRHHTISGIRHLAAISPRARRQRAGRALMLGAIALGACAQLAGLEVEGKVVPDGTNDLTATGPLFIGENSYASISDHLKGVTSFALAGSFYGQDQVSPRYPNGGRLRLAAGDPAAALAERLNHDAVLVFDGGCFSYDGQALDAKAFTAGKPAVIEQLRRLRLLSGVAELWIGNGNEVSVGTTLLFTDPADGVERRPGAALVVGGDEARGAKDWAQGLGGAEHLRFASGLARHLVGGGGPAGSLDRSIIPWMTVGTYHRPGEGRMATYDAGTGVRALLPGEYDRKILGAPDRNVWTDKLDLGPNRAQTVNALICEPYFTSEIGAGSTLTITSGFLQFGSRGSTAIGYNPNADDPLLNAGTIAFGAAEGMVWSGFDIPYGPSYIGSVITGSGGLTIAGAHVMALVGANAYTGTTHVGGGVLQIGDGRIATSRLGPGGVEVAGGATLRIAAGVKDGIADGATVTLLGRDGHHEGPRGRIELAQGIAETVARLVIEGEAQPAGTYGSSASAATHRDDAHFSGAGVLVVAGSGAAPPR